MTQQSSTTSTTADQVSQTSAANQDSRVGGEAKYGFPSIPPLSAEESENKSLFSSFTRKDDADLTEMMADAQKTFKGYYEEGGPGK